MIFCPRKRPYLLRHTSAAVVFASLNSGTVSQTALEKFLGREKTQKKNVDFLKVELSESCYSIDRAEEDADSFLVNSALHEAHLFDLVTIVAEDG